MTEPITPAVIDFAMFNAARLDFLLRAYVKVAESYEEKVIALEGLKADLPDVKSGSEDSKMLLSDIETKRKEVQVKLEVLNRVAARIRLIAPEKAPLTLDTAELYEPKEAAV